jgi:hypothetical protein
MGSIIARTRKDGTTSYTAQIVIKKGGVIVHREAETFDRKQAANAWVVKREAELKSPGGLDRKENPTLSVVIDRYIEESKNAVLGTKAQVLKTIKNSDLGDLKCNEITSQKLVAFAKDLTRNVEPQTCGNYFSHLSSIFTVARPAWGFPLTVFRNWPTAGLAKRPSSGWTLWPMNWKARSPSAVTHFKTDRWPAPG